jgi:uncharacterized membrane protein
MPPAAFDLPPLRVLARHALPRVVEGAVIPTLVFVTLLKVGGQSWAIAGAFGWSSLVIVTRLGLGRRVPTIVLLGLGALALRTAVALAADSSFLYFLQPTVGSATVGILFLATAVAGRPLVLRLARDFCPLPDDVMTHSHFRRFFLGISALWGGVQLVNSGLTLWLLLSQSIATFVLVRTTLNYTLTATAILISVLWFRRVLRHHQSPSPAFAVAV